MKHLILLLLTIISSGLTAQNDYRDGYFIKMDGDTVHCMLNYVDDQTNSQMIQAVKPGDDSTTYLPFTIKSYRFKDGKYYISKEVIAEKDTIKVFAEAMVIGKKSLYRYRMNSEFHYLLGNSTGVLREIPYQYKIVQKDGKYYEKESTKHIGFIKAELIDCPEIFATIDKMNKPNANNMARITKEYNDIICGEGSCMVFKRKKNPFRMAIEPMVGRPYYRDLGEEILSSCAIYGAQVAVWLPFSSENFYLKAGYFRVTIESINHITENANIIPIYIEYQYPYEKIIPKIYTGVNCYFNKRWGTTTAVAGAGLLAKIHDNIYLDFDLSTDVCELQWDTRFFLSLIPRLGLYIKIASNNSSQKQN